MGFSTYCSFLVETYPLPTKGNIITKTAKGCIIRRPTMSSVSYLLLNKKHVWISSHKTIPEALLALTQI